MPELPEVERVRLTLSPHLLGRRITKVTLRRRDIWTPGVSTRRAPMARQLLLGATVERLARRGKQLAIIAADGRVLCIHLGMTGRLVFTPSTAPGPSPDAHTHARWTVADGDRPVGELRFRDPRRFGGLWSLADPETLTARWAELGPDGLAVTAEDLARALGQSRRAVKAALLDQGAVAGIGNIYADEALFRAEIDPRTRCDRLDPEAWSHLAERIRTVLVAAIAAGGSTLRDYVDGEGRPGQGRDSHWVYGRGGKACLQCGQILRSITLGQRTTVFCARCQRRLSRRSRKSRHFSTSAPRRSFGCTTGAG